MDLPTTVQPLPFGLESWFRLATQKIQYRSQLVAYPYFLVSAVLFLLQIIFGLTIVAQFVWPTFLFDVFPFNIGRATHLNLLVFWLLLGLMGAAYYLIPEETRSEIFSVKLAFIQLAILIVAGLGTLFSFWFLRDSLGKPFTESPMPWPVVIALGVVLFLVNLGVTLFRSKHWTAVSIILFGGTGGLALLYLTNFIFFPNLTVAENITINQQLARGKQLVNWKEINRIAADELAKIKVSLPLDAIVDTLTTADRQLIAVVKALLASAQIIIMDEPTTALTQKEIAALFAATPGGA